MTEKTYTQADMDKVATAFKKCLEASQACYAHVDFSSGFLAHEIRYEIKTSAPINSKHLKTLINKLRVDMDNMKTWEEQSSRESGV